MEVHALSHSHLLILPLRQLVVELVEAAVVAGLRVGRAGLFDLGGRESGDIGIEDVFVEKHHVGQVAKKHLQVRIRSKVSRLYSEWHIFYSSHLVGKDLWASVELILVMNAFIRENTHRCTGQRRDPLSQITKVQTTK